MGAAQQNKAVPSDGEQEMRLMPCTVQLVHHVVLVTNLLPNQACRV